VVSIDALAKLIARRTIGAGGVGRADVGTAGSLFAYRSFWLSDMRWRVAALFARAEASGEGSPRRCAG
jgi:hypothetical protein